MAVEAAREHGHVAHHLLHFYDDDIDLVSAVTRYLATGISRGANAVVLATADHLAAFDSELRTLGVDSGEIVTVDADAVLAQIFVEGRIDPTRFDELIGGLVRKASAGGSDVRAYGELVELLWQRGAVAAAVDLEGLWDRLGEELPFQLFCAYTTPSLHTDDQLDAFNAVCQLHTDVVAHGIDVDLHQQRCAVRAFPATDHAPRAARRFLAETADGWGVQLDGGAAVVLSELTTNAVRHARSPFTVTLSTSFDAFQIVVRDESSDLPRGDGAELYAESGRGLGLVAALAERWGVRRLEGAKEIWAEVTP